MKSMGINSAPKRPKYKRQEPPYSVKELSKIALSVQNSDLDPTLKDQVWAALNWMITDCLAAEHKKPGRDPEVAKWIRVAEVDALMNRYKITLEKAVKAVLPESTDNDIKNIKTKRREYRKGKCPIKISKNVWDNAKMKQWINKPPI